MTQWGTWVSYTGSDAIVLAIVLFVIAGFLAYFGIRLRHPLEAKRPGKANTVFIIVIWLLSIITLLFCVAAYGLQLSEQNLLSTPPDNPISPITFISVVITFLLITLFTWERGGRIAILSGAAAAMAAPMIFELPYDLIVMSRTYPPIPPYPALYRGLFFLPLFIVELSTMSLLTLSPHMRVKKATMFSLAGMFFVFAVWALAGFSFPSSPIPLTMNITSKILCFVTVFTLFLLVVSSPVQTQENFQAEPPAGG
ncbi:MAG: hypothetical protein P4L50_05955 [Anaerolineaceae bacterium]|nr:hypothetical protein [Anaerolineaceae bacterium]